MSKNLNYPEISIGDRIRKYYGHEEDAKSVVGTVILIYDDGFKIYVTESNIDCIPANTEYNIYSRGVVIKRIDDVVELI